MRPKGFSVPELLIVAAIFILLSLVGMPLLVNYQKVTKLRSEARVLVTNLKYAQQLAVSEQVIYNVVLSAVNGSYQIINSETSSVRKAVTLDQEVQITGVNDLTNSTVQFTSTGSAVETGSIDLANSNNETSTVQIKPSGYVQIID